MSLISLPTRRAQLAKCDASLVRGIRERADLHPVQTGRGVQAYEEIRINKGADKKVSLFHSTIDHTAKFDQANVIGFSAWRNMNGFDKADANRVSGDGGIVASTFRYLFSIRCAVGGSITLSVSSLVGPNTADFPVRLKIGGQPYHSARITFLQSPAVEGELKCGREIWPVGFHLASTQSESNL